MIDRNNPDHVWKEWKTNDAFPALAKEGGLDPELAMALQEVVFLKRLSKLVTEKMGVEVRELLESMRSLQDSMDRLDRHLEELAR